MLCLLYRCQCSAIRHTDAPLERCIQSFPDHNLALLGPTRACHCSPSAPEPLRALWASNAMTIRPATKPCHGSDWAGCARQKRPQCPASPEVHPVLTRRRNRLYAAVPRRLQETYMPKPKNNKRRASSAAKHTKRAAPARPKAAVARAGSKTSACLALLERPEGATIDELQKATGWQPHSVRGFLAGAIKKRLMLQVLSAKEERGRVYRVLPGARPAKSSTPRSF